MSSTWESGCADVSEVHQKKDTPIGRSLSALDPQMLLVARSVGWGPNSFGAPSYGSGVSVWRGTIPLYVVAEAPLRTVFQIRVCDLRVCRRAISVCQRAAMKGLYVSCVLHILLLCGCV